MRVTELMNIPLGVTLDQEIVLCLYNPYPAKFCKNNQLKIILLVFRVWEGPKGSLQDKIMIIEQTKNQENCHWAFYKSSSLIYAKKIF